jgi:hypothetical protein
MDLNTLKNNYCSYYKLNFLGSQHEDFIDNGIILRKSSEVEVHSHENSPFFSGYKIPINTTLIADSLVSRADSGNESFLPEMALMFLKTYAKQLGNNEEQYGLNPKNLISIFNKNQELVEIPYPIVLLLGGLYYFQENDIVLTDHRVANLFDVINDVSPNGGKDAYTNTALFKKTSQYYASPLYDTIGPNGSGKAYNETIYFPSVAILNREYVNNDGNRNSVTDFVIKTGFNTNGTEKKETVNIRNKTIIPAVGYGIQNKFLNLYNKTFFGDYLNGSKTKENDGKPHVLAGGYSGILKPFKTYDSDAFEFTAFYRNLSVKNITIDIAQLKTDLKSATKKLKKSSDFKTLCEGYIKSFVVYSKLKAAYISGGISDDTKLKDLIKQLCYTDEYNIENKFNEELVSDGKEKLCDFYYLIAEVFFTIFHEIERPSNSSSNIFDLGNRLKISSSYASKYETSALGADLQTILGKRYSNVNEQIDSLTNFFSKIWGLEKINLKKEYEPIDNKAVFALYPSSGGFITPNSLLYTLATTPTKSLDIMSSSGFSYDVVPKGTSNFDDYLYKENNKPTYYKEFGDQGKDNLSSGYTLVDALQGNSFSRGGNTNDKRSAAQWLYNDLKEVADKDPIKNDPIQYKYIVDIDFDRFNFATNYCFDNHAILKNTTRFLWFENNRAGTDMLLDGNYVQNGDNLVFSGFYEFNNGIYDFFEDKNTVRNYFKSLNNSLFGHDDFIKKTTNGDFFDMFGFNRIMDSINIEKLIEFSDLFKKFATIGKTVGNEESYNLNSLVKSSSILGAEDIKEFEDPATKIKLSGEEIWYMLIGNSMFNYEFVSKSGIAKYFNVALTLAQKTRCDLVVNQFCSQEITVANKSAVDSVTKIGDFQLSIHNFHSSPEVLFTNAKTYDELKAAIKGSLSDTQFDKSISRRILLGDQYVASYSSFTSQEVTEILKLNKSYLFSKFHHTKKAYLNTNFDNFYLDIVRTFFEFLNIKYTKNNYKQLLKLIRSFTNQVLTKYSDIVISDYLPNNGFVTEQKYTEVQNKNGYTVTLSYETKKIEADNTYVYNPRAVNVPEQYTETDTNTNYTSYTIPELKTTAETFFNSFAKNTFESVIENLNGFLSKINSLAAEDLSPQSGGLTTEAEKESLNDELKKSTYYNIKAIYDKISVGNMSQSIDSFVPTKISELKSLDAGTVLDQTKLFYNYSINPNDCFGLTPLNGNSYDLFEIFKVVDRGNNDIGTRVIANLGQLYDNLYADFDNEPNTGQPDQSFSVSNLTNSTFYKLFDDIAKNSGFMYQQIPNYLNLNGAMSATKNNAEEIYDIVDQLFGVHTDTELLGDSKTKRAGLTGFPGNIFQLGTEGTTVNTSDRTNYVNKNNNLDSFCLDVGLDPNGEIRISDEDAPDDIKKSNVTCFTVDFGTQNQQMFNSLQIDTQEFLNTEESINTWVNLVNNSQETLQTTNLFPILEKRSYTCTVTSLGNATIQPLSYFYLRNVPLFYGTYWITNVMHQIQPNTMITTFKGVRQPIATKTDVRKQLLTLLRKRAEEIQGKLESVNTLQTTEIPNTQGSVYIINDNNSSSIPYGQVFQQLSDGSKYYRFNSIDVIGAFIYSVTNNNNANNSNLGLVATLYNQAAALSSSTNHSTAISNMIKIVVGTMKQRAELGDERYSSNGIISLSKLIKNSGYSTNFELSTLLNDITQSYTKYNDLVTLPKVNLYDLKLNQAIDKANLSSTVSFVTGGNPISNVDSSNIDIKESTFYFEEADKLTKANTEIYGIGSGSENDIRVANLNDLFTSFGADKGSVINDIKTEKQVNITIPGNATPKEPPFEKMNSSDLNKWMTFMEECSPQAAKFALFISDGSYGKKDYDDYLKKNGWIDSDGDYEDSDDKWDNIPKTTGNRAIKAVFSRFYTDDQVKDITVTDPGGTDVFDDVSYHLPGSKGGYKQYNFGDNDDREKFISDYGDIFTEKEDEWKNNNAPKNTNENLKIKVKFLGSIEPGKVSFFTSKQNDASNYGKSLVWSTTIKQKYNLDNATSEQLENEYVAPTLGNENRSSFITSLIGNVNREKTLWEGKTESSCNKDAVITQALTNYWGAVGVTGPNCGTAWSAAFISYVIKEAGQSGFPYAANHNTYITSIRDKNISDWKAYKSSDPTNGVLQVGDIVCHGADADYNPQPRDLSEFAAGQASHCDCVVAINGSQVVSIGGNVGDTVGNWPFSLKSDGTIDSSKTPFKTVILRYEPSGSSFTPSEGNFTSVMKYPTLMQTILGKESNGYDDYNYYNPGLRSYLATGGFTPYGALTKPLSQYTIGEIQAFQKAPESPSPGRLHATGRYQIIPTTLTGILSSAGLTASDMYNAENQDKLGMALLSSRTLKYLNKELPDTVENLENAALDIAKTWSSVGVPYDMKGAFINVKKNEGYYKKQGTAVDSGGTKTEDVQAALKYERNKSGSQPAASNNTTAGFSTVVIGDSLYYSIRAANSKIQLITTPQMAQASKHLDSDRADGSGGKSLLTLLKEAKVFTDVKNVIVTIGANDLWTLNTAKQNEAIGLIKSKFPNAKYYIMNGNYGWGGLKVEGANTDAVWISKINNYVNVFKQGGFEVIGQVTKVLVHPAPNDTFYKTYETKLKTFV